MKPIKWIENIISSRRELSILKIIKKKHRYKQENIVINKLEITFIDSLSFFYQYKDIFEKKIYNFKSKSNSPLIIDCGSNIGLSILFFKGIYPKSRVIAFEPDPSIFSVLKENIERNGYNDVELINKAVWTNETVLGFLPDGADGGRIPSIEGDGIIVVPAACLSSYIDEQVDFLKIDIEGAETVVLRSCKDKLNNVNNIFIEYHSMVNEKQSLHQLLQILSEANFRVHINSISEKKQPFIQRERNSFFDMQLNIFAFR